MSRVLVVWCPDWPAMVPVADLPADSPLAVLAAGVVLACTPAARADGVRRGMRRRDAQSRCPDLVLADHDPVADAKAFEPVLTTLEELGVAVAPIRPGLVAMAVPARYHGGEAEGAAAITQALVESVGVWDVRCGVADGVFAAEQAARQAPVQECVVVPAGGSAAFLRPQSVEVFDDPTFTGLLHRLGLHTLGSFADLPAADVHTRFGAAGAARHRLARGAETTALSRRAIPPDLHQQVAFEPAVDSAETVAFSVRRAAEAFVGRIADQGAVCSAVRIGFAGSSRVHSRLWRHPRWFGPADLVDRVRWQADALGEPVVEVTFVPEVLESAGDHAEALFGGGVDERVERGIARVQSMVGPDSVQSIGVQGGRSPGDRRLTATWGEQAVVAYDATRPWPGSIPAPAPATVLPSPAPAQVVGHEGQPVLVSGRGALVGEPARVRIADAWHRVQAWAGPWPVDERWWDEHAARRIARFQVVGVDGSAWLMVVENGSWWLEAVYD